MGFSNILLTPIHCCAAPLVIQYDFFPLKGLSNSVHLEGFMRQPP